MEGEELRRMARRVDVIENILNNHGHLGFDQTEPLSTPRIMLQDAATIAVNCSLGSHFYVTLGGNRTLANPSNPKDGQRIVFEIIQDGTGSRTLTLGSKFAYGVTLSSFTLTTTAAKRDFIGAIYSAADDKFYVVAFADGY
ncbi:hypothetical protein KW797_00515 [Candidatus Parcubacteria bacterium]|nr:hypothetical protein [Candidatus Parcubacteria bacterium]